MTFWLYFASVTTPVKPENIRRYAAPKDVAAQMITRGTPVRESTELDGLCKITHVIPVSMSLLAEPRARSQERLSFCPLGFTPVCCYHH